MEILFIKLSTRTISDDWFKMFLHWDKWNSILVVVKSFRAFSNIPFEFSMNDLWWLWWWYIAIHSNGNGSNIEFNTYLWKEGGNRKLNLIEGTWPKIALSQVTNIWKKRKPNLEWSGSCGYINAMMKTTRWW